MDPAAGAPKCWGIVLGKLRAVGAFVTHVVNLLRALLSIAALRAVGRILKCSVLSEKKAVRSADGFQKTVSSWTLYWSKK